MAADADICNRALGNIGVIQTITALTDATKLGRTCDRYYSEVLDALLALREWPFAERISLLALSPVTIPGWAYCYALPANCLRLSAVVDEAGARTFSRQTSWGDLEERFLPDWPHRLFDDDTGTLIATDVEDAYGVMVWRVTDPAKFPPAFRVAFSWMLGAAMAPALVVDAKLAQYASEQSEVWLERAAAVSYNQSVEDPQAESPSVRVRG